MQFTLREMDGVLTDLSQVFGQRRLWLTYLLVVAVFVVTAPLDTARMSMLERIGFWTVAHGGAWSISLFFWTIGQRLVSQSRRGRSTFMTLGSAVFATPPIALWTGLLSFVFENETPNLSSFLQDVSDILPLALAFTVLCSMTMGRRDDAAASPGAGGFAELPLAGPSASEFAATDGKAVAAPDVAQVPLLDRLKPEHHGPILMISTDDHYCQIYTSRGREMVYVRFSDALRELGGSVGLQVHRSYWVADRFVERLVRDNGRWVIATRNGEMIPVSRTYLPEVRARYSR